MKDITKWFNNDNGHGFIEYKDNGNVLIYYSTNEEKKYIEFIKINEGYKIKKD